jgi:hypothetical protein
VGVSSLVGLQSEYGFDGEVKCINASPNDATFKASSSSKFSKYTSLRKNLCIKRLRQFQSNSYADVVKCLFQWLSFQV